MLEGDRSSNGCYIELPVDAYLWIDGEFSGNVNIQLRSE
jgi:hypothetical protein